MNRNKKSFLLHIDSLDILDDLTDEQAGKLFKAIKAYQKHEELELDSFVKIAFSPFKNQFARDNEKYDLTCKRRAEAGRKGGNAKASKSQQEVAKASKSQQEVANLADSKNKNKTKSKSDSDSKKEISKSAKANNDVLEIFNHWKLIMKKSNSAILNAKRSKTVEARLKEGYTVEQIKQAIEGCSMTPHNMGQNNNGKKYDDLELICRDGTQVERFANNAYQLQPQAYGQHVGKTLDALNNMEWDDDL